MLIDLNVEQALDAAIAHHQAGRFDNAKAAYRAIIDHTPDHPDALNLLGLILQDQGELTESIALISHALEIEPDFPEALSNLARVRRMTGDPAAAAQAARQAIALDPALPEAHLQLGHALIDLGDHNAALEPLAQATTLAPHAQEALRQLGIARLRLKDYPEAARVLRAALDLDPAHVETMVHLGTAMAGLERLDDALALHEQAAAAAPHDATTHAALAVTLRRRLDPLRSITACRRALELSPDRADLWLLLGANLASAGDFDAAQACCRKVLELDPDSSEARRDLAMIGQQSDDTAEIIRLQAVLDTPATPGRERIAAGFALGTLLDHRGDHDAAFAGYEAANRLMHAALAAQGKGYDAAGLHNYVDWAINIFRKDTMQATNGWGDPSELPVFIVGMPRSGTTLIEQICASHSKVFGAGERRAIGEVVRALHGGDTHLPPWEWNRYSVRKTAAAQVAALCEQGGDATRVIDKMPDNTLILGYIAVLFPNARVIICRRDIRDTCLSCYFQQFGEGNAWAFDQADLASRAREVERLMHHWRKVLPLRMIDVRYEDLVADQEAETRRLLAFLGLEWDPACLAFHETDRPVMTASVWQVRQAMYASSIGRWRNYRRHLAPLLVGLAGILPPDASEDDAAEDWDALASDPAAALALAAPHHAEGRLDCAEPIYRALLRRDPDDPVALHLLGLLMIDRGSAQQAVALITRSLEWQPDAPATLADLARACRAAGDPDAAVTAARQAVTLDPDLPDAHVQLGCALSVQEDFPAAIKALQHALEHAPRSLEARIFLAAALFRVSDFAASAQQWQAVVDAKPEQPDYLIEYAAAVGELRHFDESLQAYRKALVLAPGHTRAMHGIGWALLQSGDAAGAVDACQDAVKLLPNDPNLRLTLANAFAALGRFDAASEAFEQTLALDASSGEAMTGQGKVGKGLNDATARDAVRAVLLDTARPDRERVSAGFALGAAHDRSSEYDRAFEAYATANRLLKAHRAAHGFAFDRQDLTKLVNWLIANITPATFAHTAGFGHPSETPVFIVGLPRSGTTLVEQIAASHPSVVGSGERRDIPGILAALNGEQTARHPAMWDRTALRREATAHVQRLQATGQHALRVIDKLPDNIMWLGQIAVLFPDARIIICRRDLRDICLSCFFQYFRDDAMMWTDDLADCAFRAMEIERLTAHWLKVLPGAVLQVQYETLVANLESESRRLIGFLGLEWDPACLSFHNTERTVLTASHWQVRQPLYATSVGRWRRYEKHLGPMLRELNPALRPPPPP